MSHLLLNGELVLYGDVGSPLGDGTGFNAREVREALAAYGDEGELVVRINSGGGSVWEGIAIYNMLKERGDVTTVVDGIAASAASVIALAGDVIVMATGSTLMIHEPMADTWGGSAAEHSKSADTLDQLGEQIASIYAAHTGISATSVREMMLAETWLTAEDAVEMGFATQLADTTEEDEAMSKTKAKAKEAAKVTNEDEDEDEEMSASASTVRAESEEEDDPENAVRAEDEEDDPENSEDEDEDDPENEEDDDEEEKPAARAKRAKAKNAIAPQRVVARASGDRTLQIFNRCRDARLSVDQTNDIIARAKGNVGKAKNLIINMLADNDTHSRGGAMPARTIMDARDKFVKGATAAVMARAGMDGGERNEYTSMTLRELAKESLVQSGVKNKFSDPMMMIGAAFNPARAGIGGFQPRMDGAGMHSTSDFASILANVANKSMMKGYEETEESFESWTTKGTLTDFKIASRVDLGMFPSLTEVPEGAEYKFATMGERATTIQLATYGKMFAITRQSIINDDLSAFTRIPMRMGRAAKRTVGNLVWALITDNPVMADGVALFHANHSNLVDTGSGAAPDVATVDAGRAAMALQTDADGVTQTGLNLRPAYFLVPVELEGVAKQLMAAQYDPAADKLQAPNYVAGLAQVVSDARLSSNSATAWYLAASPSATDTIEVAYLNGVSTPTMEQREGWNVDGTEFKVRIDAGVQVLDHRGFYKNAGA